MSRSRRISISAALAVLATTFLAGGADAQAPSAQAQANKPNLVFILADNVGYGDMGPYGGGELRGFPTPRIDQCPRRGHSD